MIVRRALALLPAPLLLLLVAVPAFAQEATFSDTAGTRQEDAVSQLAEQEIVQGCAEELFCTRDELTRGQVATIVTRALGLAVPAGELTPRFADATESTHRGAIEAVALAGLAEGCEEGRFCPNDPVTREQLATILTRAFDVPEAPGGVTYFDDVRGVHGPAIESIAEAGIANGCSLVEFCATTELQRGHAAMFFARALDLVDRVELAPYADRAAEHEEVLAAEREAAAAAKAKAEAAAAKAAAEANAPAQKAVDVALAQVGKPYRWAGSGSGSFDCSGLTSYAWKQAGVTLPRSSRAQQGGTQRISRGDLRPGDLVFYHSPVSHVAMYIGDGKVVEAANSRYDVRIRNDGLTRKGVVGYGRPKY